MKDGIIKTDSIRGKLFGLTSDKFRGDTYLWKDGRWIIISLINVKHQRKGYMTELFNIIEKEGYKIAVPTPIGRMVIILEKKGFHPQHYEDVEMWSKGVYP